MGLPWVLLKAFNGKDRFSSVALVLERLSRLFQRISEELLAERADDRSTSPGVLGDAKR